MSEPFAVILVESTSHALHIEKLLAKHNLTCKLIPVPRHLSSDCGVCVRILKKDLETIKFVIQKQGIELQAIEEL